MADAIIKQLQSLFVESLHIEVPSAETDLIETGLLDSLQMVELLLQLEQRFCFKIKIDEVDLDNLRTLSRIAELLDAHGAATGKPKSSARAASPADRNLHRDTEAAHE
ncbi:MAG: acyl carrier protein [Betaproteobacteria bacterium]|nr:acyl carrier protein [Betaproteobacteria bacterium]